MSLSKFLATIEGNKLTALDLMAVRSGVPVRQLHNFWKWCFGDDYRKVHPSKLKDRWNNKHSDYMIIMAHHSIPKSVELMAAIWCTL